MGIEDSEILQLEQQQRENIFDLQNLYAWEKQFPTRYYVQAFICIELVILLTLILQGRLLFDIMNRSMKEITR